MADADLLTVDVAIIGAGTAGMNAYRAARARTPRVCLIEDGPYGTMCARVGCMPSKLLIAAADAAHAARGAHRFGVHAGPVRVDGVAVMDRVRRERDRFVGFVQDAVAQWPPEHRLQGTARFLDDHTLQVGGQRVHAARIVLATGSQPAVPPGWRQALGDRLIVNDDVFAWHTLPESVAVVGAGVIGLELAQALHRLGVRVRLVGRESRVGPLTDPVLRALAAEVIAEDLPLTLGARAIEPRREGGHVVLRLTDATGQVTEESFDLLLAATGRRPRLDDLDLARTTLPLDAAGVPLHDRHTGQVADRPVFIAGDAAADHPLLHEAADDGRIAGDNAGRWPDVRQRPRRAGLAVVFCEPQMAIAGQAHADLVRAGTPFVTGRVSFDDQGRSRVMLRNRGALHVYAQAGSGRLLGAEMLGPAAEHIGHLLAWSVQRGDTVQQMLDSPFYHPVVEEGLRTALRDAQATLGLGPPPVERCLDCGPGA
jgi:dihydrolipoamide dehydrogenase